MIVFLKNLFPLIIITQLFSLPIIAQRMSLPSMKYDKAKTFKDYKTTRKNAIRGYTWTIGYNNSSFLTSQFGNSVKNNNIQFRYGIFWNQEFQMYPFVFNLKTSNANFRLQDATYEINHKVKQRNLEIGTNLILDIPFGKLSKILIPYIGAGYNFSSLKDSLRIDADYFVDGYSGYLTPTPLAPVEESGFIISGPFFKTGTRININNNLFITGEYMQTFYARDSDFDFNYDYSQWSVGLGFCFGWDENDRNLRKAGLLFAVPISILQLLIVKPW